MIQDAPDLETSCPPEPIHRLARDLPKGFLRRLASDLGLVNVGTGIARDRRRNSCKCCGLLGAQV